MSVVSPGRGQPSFGKRQPTVAGRRPPSPAPSEPARRTSTISRESDAQLETLKEAAGALHNEAKQTASWWWAYIQASAAAYAAVITSSVLLFESRNPMTEFSVFATVIGIIVAPTLSTMLLVPTLVLTRLVRLFRIPRGYADVLVGGLLGSIWLITRLSDGRPIEGLEICFVIGGLVGGFVFWRAQGYPGASTASAKALDEAYARVR